jgi:sugar phosphate isomerase/epimerase
MTDIQTELGAQSYCFRHFKDNAKTIELLRQCGLQKIELCGVHADFSDESGFDDVISTYRDAGVEIVSIGVQGFSGNKKREEKYFEFARRAGCHFISADFDIAVAPEAFTVAEELAAQYDIKLAIHNHGGRHWLGNAQTLRNVFQNTSERIGLCLDTAWALDAHEDPIALIAEFGARLYGLHIKDFVFDRAGQPEDVVVGSGNLDLSKLRSTLAGVNFAGYAVLEYEGDVENPVPALQQCVAAVRAA